LVPQLARVGDMVCILRGLRMLFLFRQNTGHGERDGYGKEEVWDIVGNCYVHGLMEGEVLSQDRQEKHYVVC
jgi:hypothetical protein